MATTKTTTTAELVKRYNTAAKALGRKPVKRFANRKTAERRVKAIEAELRPTALQGGAADYYPDAAGTRRGFTFDLPGRPAKERVEPREGSMRARLLGMLQDAGKDGIAFDKLHKACGFLNRKSTRDALYLLSAKNGYAITGTDEAVRLSK